MVIVLVVAGKFLFFIKLKMACEFRLSLVGSEMCIRVRFYIFSSLTVNSFVVAVVKW